MGRNTAPAIALACFALDEEEIVLVTPSDHLIKDETAYLEAMKKAKTFAQSGYLVTFGITPKYPETGFGYIEAEPQSVKRSGLSVKNFKEKPDLLTAKNYLSENLALNAKRLALKYYWNSGMFCFKAGVFLEELKKYSPRIYGESLMALIVQMRDQLIRITHDEYDGYS